MPAARVDCVSVDLGKTKVRLRRYGMTPRWEAVGDGAPGLADVGGPAASAASILNALATQTDATIGSVGCWSVGAAGAAITPTAASELAGRLRAALGAPVIVTSDMVTAHVGATGGLAGTLLIAGTGAVALRVAVDGRTTRSDGWGPHLGDEGSGRWVGQRGLNAALRAADGRGPRTELQHRAVHFSGGLDALPGMTSGPDAAARLAAFAPVVLAAAAAEDEVAMTIVREATRALAVTSASVRSEDSTVYATGGLTENPLFRAELHAALKVQGLELKSPCGDALDGAAVLAAHTDLPVERLVVRV
ncbi:N-acetylglucosamine kinase [Microbacterium sp.]|uniref:N-acetylglucosamine kinase n=1 Tax=Microbacterium sp. TaxID=51671 RepID=UPI003C716CF9